MLYSQLAWYCGMRWNSLSTVSEWSHLICHLIMSWEYGGKNFRVTPQTVGASKLCTIAKAWSLLVKSKLSQKKKSSQYYTACVGLFFVCWFYFIFPFLSPSLRLCFSSDHLQVPEQQPFWIKANPVQSEPCTRLSVPIHLSREAWKSTFFSVFLWLPANLSQLINVSQPVRTSRVRSGTSEPKWRHEGQAGSACF